MIITVTINCRNYKSPCVTILISPCNYKSRAVIIYIENYY
nr:MAG TPA: hypothetical protein [Caudoviricetes sp.]